MSAPSVPVEQVAEFVALPPPRLKVPEVIRKAAMRQSVPRWTLILIGFITAVSLSIAYTFLPWHYFTERRLERGLVGEATIESITFAHASENRQRVMRYDYIFHTPAGQRQAGHCFATSSSWTVGANVPVRFLADRPDISCLVGGRLDTFSSSSVFVGGFPLITLGGLGWALRSRRRMARLLRQGKGTQARVAGIESTPMKVSGHPVHAITLIPAGGEPIVIRRHRPEDVELVTRRRDEQLPVALLCDPGTPNSVLFLELL